MVGHIVKTKRKQANRISKSTDMTRTLVGHCFWVWFWDLFFGSVWIGSIFIVVSWSNRANVDLIKFTIYVFNTKCWKYNNSEKSNCINFDVFVACWRMKRFQCERFDLILLFNSVACSMWHLQREMCELLALRWKTILH